MQLQALEVAGKLVFSDTIQVAELPNLDTFYLKSFIPGDALTSQNVVALSALAVSRQPKIDTVVHQAEELEDLDEEDYLLHLLNDSADNVYMVYLGQ